MSSPTCDAVNRALRNPSPENRPPTLEAELAAHAHYCPTCAEALSVATALQQAASLEPPRPGLPSASHLWWRAQIIRDLMNQETIAARATRSARWMQGIGLGLLCLLIALALSGLTASLFSGLQLNVGDDHPPWGLFVGLLLAGTVFPCAGFAAWWWLSEG